MARVTGVWRTSRRVPIAVFRIDRPSFEAALLVGYGVVYVGLAAVAGLLIRAHPLPILDASRFNHDVWYALFFKLTMLGLVPAGVFVAMGYRPRDLFPHWHLTAKRLAGLVAAFLIAALLYWEYLAEIKTAAIAFEGPEFALRVAIGAVLPLFTAALPEEIVYRGLMQSRIERAVGRAPAVIVTATLFAAFHIPSRFLLATGGSEGTAGDLLSVIVGTGIPALIVGLVFSVIWDRYRSLMVLIAAHWGIDILPSITSLVGVRF